MNGGPAGRPGGELPRKVTVKLAGSDEQVEAKVVTHAAKRVAEAAAVSAAEEAHKMALGAARAATRPPSTSIIVDNALRVHRM